jgi:hypothetical protein
LISGRAAPVATAAVPSVAAAASSVAREERGKVIDVVCRFGASLGMASTT